MLKVVMYSSRKSRLVAFSSISSQGVYWLDATRPNEKELEQIKSKLQIVLRDLKDTIDPRELSRIVNHSKYTLLIFRVPFRLGTTSLGIFIGDSYVLTVHKENLNFLKRLHSSLELNGSSKKELSLIVYRILLSAIREYSLELDKIGYEVESTENRIFKGQKETNLSRLFSLKKKLLYYRKSLTGNEQILDQIDQASFISRQNRELFMDLRVELTQVSSVLEVYRERLVEGMNLYVSSLSNRLNVIMKSFTVITSLLLLPMLISGVWGMNFSFIPFYTHPYGFYFPIVLMILSVSLMLLYFKHKSWL